jgi:uncharacterized membrane protein YdjX (TVP38/TMEM64 family)
MAGWYATRTLPRSTKLVIGLALLAVVLVAAVPVAFLIGVILMLFGHVIGGLALFGGSILAAVGAIGLAAVTGVRQVRHLREMLAGRDVRVVSLSQDDYSS